MPHFAYENGKQAEFPWEFLSWAFTDENKVFLKKSIGQRCWKTILPRLSIDRCFTLNGFGVWIRARSALEF